jgi:hypothetical protein
MRSKKKTGSTGISEYMEPSSDRKELVEAVPLLPGKKCGTGEKLVSDEPGPG